MPPRVAIDALALGDPPQGLGAYSLSLVRALADGPADLEFMVFLPAGGVHLFRELERPFLRLVPCRLPPGRAGRTAYQHLYLPLLAGKRGAGLLHALANLLPLGHRGRSVLTIHDLDFMVHPGFSPPARRLLFRALTPSSVRRADLVAADSEYTAETIRRHLPGAAGKVRVVPLGSPPGRPVPEAERLAVLERHGLGAPYFLSLGTLEKRKNLVSVLRAFEAYVARTRRADLLVLAGSPGWGHGEILAAARSSPAAGLIRMTDFVPAGDLPGLYAGATALLLFSEAEGFGLPALEAQAAGCPVVAAGAGALPETCGRAALFVDPSRPLEAAEAMVRVGLEAERQRLAAEGTANLQRFSWRRHALTLREIYRALL